MLLLSLFTACNSLSHTAGDTTLLSASDKELIQSGDILFRRGRTLTSNAVVSADSEGFYSHVGLAVEVDGELMVTHAVPGESEGEYVCFESIDSFFAYRKAKHGAIMRYPLDSTSLSTIEKVAKEVVEKSIPFDHEYNAECNKKLYCTEYIWLLFNSIGIDITRAQRSEVNFYLFDYPIIMPSHIFEHPDLTLITKF